MPERKPHRPIGNDIEQIQSPDIDAVIAIRTNRNALAYPYRGVLLPGSHLTQSQFEKTEVCLDCADIAYMQLWRLIYISQAVHPLPQSALVELVAHSRQRNEEIGISGLLLATGTNFMQVLEGEQLVVTSLYHKISRDPRHFEVRQLLSHSTPKRLFGEWGMSLAETAAALVMDQQALEKRLMTLRLSNGNDETAAATALSLLEEFKSQLMKQCA